MWRIFNILPLIPLSIACGHQAGSAAPPGRPTVPDAGTVASPTHGAATISPPVIFTILFSNHDYAEVLDSPNAPYFNELIAKYGLATNYHDSGAHPSLPNCLELASGDTQYPAIVDLEPTAPPFPSKSAHLGSQLEAGRIPWRSYQESMGRSGALAAAGLFAPRHDPFLYFDDIQNGSNGLCAARNVDYSQFAADLAGGTYRFMWISPNLRNDGHDPTADPVTALKMADSWAQANVPQILESAAFKTSGVMFLVWDEAEGRNGNSKSQVPMIILSPRIKTAGYRSNTRYDHKSYLATVEDLLGLPRLPAVANAPSMLEFFR
jgi:hypothetical protein